MSDWTGNKQTVFSTMGASSHAIEEREGNDFYATDPKAIDILINECPYAFSPDIQIWEPACGLGHMAKRLIELGYNVRYSDLINRGYGDTPELDFLNFDSHVVFKDGLNCNIITNPPYKFAKEFVEKALDVVKEGNMVAMFLKLQFLEGKARKKMFIENPPRFLMVSSSRILCGKNGDFNYEQGSAVAYAWYVWEKGYKGRTEILWVN